MELAHTQNTGSSERQSIPRTVNLFHIKFYSVYAVLILKVYKET